MVRTSLIRPHVICHDDPTGVGLALVGHQPGFVVGKGNGQVRLDGDAHHRAGVGVDAGGNVNGDHRGVGGVNLLNYGGVGALDRPVNPDPEDGVDN